MRHDDGRLGMCSYAPGTGASREPPPSLSLPRCTRHFTFTEVKIQSRDKANFHTVKV